jgi:hypothetical protein
MKTRKAECTGCGKLTDHYHVDCQPTHTPNCDDHARIPWEAEGREIISRDWDLIARVHQGYDCDENKMTDGMMRENAAFIVRAVNSHGDLLEAVKWAYDAAKDHGYFNQVIEDRIAQAEGK